MQATVVRLKKDLKGENNAREVSDALPFVEYEIHRQLVSFENHSSIYLECYASQHFKFLSNLLRLTKILILNVKDVYYSCVHFGNIKKVKFWFWSIIRLHILKSENCSP
jgi:hypothetical protein